MLRIAVGACFIGHGAWGIVQKQAWLVFYSPFGFSDEVALMSMPIIGAIDILVGISILVFPTKAGLAYTFVWATWTALLRPIVGLGWWEFLERGGNYGPPLAMLLIAVAIYPGVSGFFKKLEPPEELDPAMLLRVAWVLRISIAFLLIGHGGFGLFQGKPMLLEHLGAIGIGDGTEASLSILRVQGAIEIGLAFVVIALPSHGRWRTLFVGAMVFIVVWKVATELLYPIANPGMDVFEFVERAGDYFAPLALIALPVRVGSALPSPQPDTSHS